MRPFDELCLKEPRLRVLEETALNYTREFGNHVPRCRNWFWFHGGPDRIGLQTRLLEILPGGRDYEICEAHLTERLPDCFMRNCHVYKSR